VIVTPRVVTKPRNGLKSRHGERKKEMKMTEKEAEKLGVKIGIAIAFILPFLCFLGLVIFTIKQTGA